MRPFALLALLAALGTSPIASLDPGPPDLVVHEWGTFTTMQGSDGVELEGLHHEEEALPAFVHDLAGEWAGSFGLASFKGLAASVRAVTTKMETPVIYFYAPRGLAVRARVTFERGLVTQWFPRASEVGAEGLDPVDPHERIDFARVERGVLEWEAEVLAPGEGREDVPETAADSPWVHARLPESNAVRVAAADGAALETEGFLFYRGLGRIELPLRVRTSHGGRLAIENASRDPRDSLGELFVLHVGGGRANLVRVGALAARATVAVRCPLDESSPALDETVAVLHRELAAALEAAGLFPDEAEAMVRTWEASYFHSEGLRVLYVVPRHRVDAILPLEIEPRPRELVRVLLARLECLTPEREDAVEAALARWAAGDVEAGSDELGREGRFLEANLRRALARTSDGRIADVAREWLGEL